MCGEAVHFLMVGDTSDVAMIKAILRRLPVNAYGQVMIEAEAPWQSRPIEAPVGVNVRWLYRERASTNIARGEMAADAIRAWVEEWMPEHPENDTPYVLWIGCSAAEQVDRIYWDLRSRLPQLHLHHPHYDHIPTDHPDRPL